MGRLCRMKQVILQDFNQKLSEMAFQCTKLIDLFNREPLADTFVLGIGTDGKSITVRLADPKTFSEHIKELYVAASASEVGVAADQSEGQALGSEEGAVGQQGALL